MPKKQKPNVVLPKLTLDFTKYPELYKVVMEIQEHSYLPIEHVLMNLISNGIVIEAERYKENRAIINLQEAQKVAEPF